MSYFRTRFSSYEEFCREGLAGAAELGREELELLEELDDEDRSTYRPRRRRSSIWE